MASLIQRTWVWAALRDGEGQGSLTCCRSWGCKELDTTEQLNNKKRINRSHSQLRGCTETGSLAFACGLSLAQMCLTLCDPMDCSPPGSSVHGITQVRILEWIAISFSRGSSQSRNWTCVSFIGRWVLYLLNHRRSLSFADPWAKAWWANGGESDPRWGERDRERYVWTRPHAGIL